MKVTEIAEPLDGHHSVLIDDDLTSHTTIIAFIDISSYMAPKTEFSIPMGKVINVETHTKKSKRTVRTTEAVIPLPSSKQRLSGKASGIKHKEDLQTDQVKAHASGHRSHLIEESHALQLTQAQDDVGHDVEPHEECPIPNVCIAVHVHNTLALTTWKMPMDEWLEHRAKYLDLLLEMEGLTRAPKCSMCSSSMALKCSDCIGGNYFCVTCCLQAHIRSPFHRLARWTGLHFAPTSLYSLGFKLCLGHAGDPCPLTVEVWSFSVQQWVQLLMYMCVGLQGKAGAKTEKCRFSGQATSHFSGCTAVTQPWRSHRNIWPAIWHCRANV